jgi:PAS domain S-box-containing protein
MTRARSLPGSGHVGSPYEPEPEALGAPEPARAARPWTAPLDRAEALLAAIIESCDDAIVTCDRQWRLTSWGVTATRLFGRCADDTLGERLDTLFSEELRSEVLAVMDRVAAGERILHFESEVLRADGLPMPVSVSLTPVAAGHASIGAVVIVRDVTEQVLAQALLAEVEARLAESEAHAHVGSWLWDRRTGAVQWSAEFHRLHEVDPLDFGGTLESFLAAVHPEDRGRLREALEASTTSGSPVELDYRVAPAADGAQGVATKVVRVRAQPTLGSRGVVVGLRGTAVVQDCAALSSARQDG